MYAEFPDFWLKFAVAVPLKSLSNMMFTGLGILGENVFSASGILTLGIENPLLVLLSIIGVPVLVIAAKTWSTLASGVLDLMTAHVPAIWGVAMDVPLAVLKVLFGEEEVIDDPGAKIGT